MFFEESSNDPNIQRSLADAKRVRAAVRQADEKKVYDPAPPLRGVRRTY
jgi:hypothetical protein